MEARGRFDWQEQAACAVLVRELGMEAVDAMFFPERGSDTRPAKQVCGSCAVQAECLNYARDLNINFGVYGGASVRERHRAKGWKN